MNKKNFLFIFLFIFMAAFSLHLQAANHVLIIGGGGEHDTNSTIFDTSLGNLGSFLQTSPLWEQSLSFNDGHKKTDDLLHTYFNVPNKPFTVDEYKKQIADFKLKIEQGKAGEQFMIYLDSHGAVNDGQEVTHRISTNDGGTNLDNLKELITLAKNKNIKLAIIDLSCQSGNTMKLDDGDNTTCFISATSSNNFSFGDFSDSLTKNMIKGENLEDLFLMARAHSKSRSLPMINTPIGKSIQEKELQIENNFFYDLDDPITKINKLDEYMKLKLKENGACKEFVPNQEFINLITKVEDMSAKTSKGIFWDTTTKDDFSLFKKSLNDYANFQNDLKTSYLKLDAFDGHQESFTAPDKIQSYSLDELYNINTDTMIEVYQRAINTATTDDVKKFYRGYQKMYEDIKLRQMALKENSDVQKMLLIEDEIKGKSKKAYELSGLIANGERDFYKSLYNSLKKDEATKQVKNACRDFVL